MMLCSRAPTRISFAGGGTDIPDIAKRIGGCATSAAISRYIYATLEPRKDRNIRIRSVKFGGSEENIVISLSRIKYGKLDLVKSVIEELCQAGGFNITIKSEVPEHSGLGASASAYAALIALFNAYYKLGMTKRDMAELSFRLETEKLKNKVGKQDQYAACFGGLNFMEFSKDMGVNISPIKTSLVTDLEKNIALLYIIKRAKTAGDVIKTQAKRFAGSADAMLGFAKTKELGGRAKAALEGNDIEEFGRIMALVWKYKKKFSPETTTPFIEKVYETAMKNGAYGGKISGAGGGGCGFWLCRDGTKSKVVTELEKMGAKNLDFRFDFDGVKTWKI